MRSGEKVRGQSFTLLLMFLVIHSFPDVFAPCGEYVQLVRRTRSTFTWLADPIIHNGPLMN